jgi:hypothetical protein
MTDPISTPRLAQCHPLLQQKVNRVDARLAPQGIIIRVTSGLRNNDEQAADWAKGRNAAGVVIDERAVVTHAPPGYSAHNFGVAVDCVPGIRGVTPWHPNYDVTHPDFITMIRAFVAEGLVAGIHWPKPKTDPDHFQLAEFPVTPTQTMRDMLAQQGMLAVWNTVGPQEATA